MAAMTPEASRAFCCVETRTSVDRQDSRAIGLGIDRYVKWIEAGYEGPFQWNRSWGSTAAKGFEAQTRLQFSASVERVEYVDEGKSEDFRNSNPLICPNVSCSSYLDLYIHVRVATADGAVSGEGDLHATTAVSAESLSGGADLPIAAFTGKLDLGVTPTERRTGGMLIALQFSDAGMQGSLTPWITGVDPSEGGVDYRGPLVGQWPVPTCMGKGLPIGLDTGLDSASGRTTRELFAEVTSQIRAMSTTASLDRAITEMTVELPGEIDYACDNGPAGVNVMTSLHFRSTDGKLDEVLPTRFQLVWDPGAEPVVWSWQAQTEVLDKDSLEALAGPLAEGKSEREAMIVATGNNAVQGTWAVNGATGKPLTSLGVEWCSENCALSVE
ncbi:MAG TPA: hypothetical protein VFS67_01960 [Polyangiaceae bacterium]|nr:hypothetical protein [Polyangiaceae bacterium]